MFFFGDTIAVDFDNSEHYLIVYTRHMQVIHQHSCPQT
jgi:hypothetical protein